MNKYQTASFALLIVPSFYIIGLLMGLKTAHPTQALIIVTIFLALSTISLFKSMQPKKVTA